MSCRGTWDRLPSLSTGVTYEIDLSTKNANKLRAAFELLDRTRTASQGTAPKLDRSLVGLRDRNMGLGQIAGLRLACVVLRLDAVERIEGSITMPIATPQQYRQ